MHEKDSISIIAYVIYLFDTCYGEKQKPHRSCENDEWQFKQSISQNWLPAQVPEQCIPI